MTGRDPRSCGDCGANPGEEHDDGCDVARCLVTGRQRISCDMLTTVFGYRESLPHDDCGSQVWSGEWPGAAECEEYDWWAHESPASQKWMQENGVPGGDKPHHNLNRLAVECEWDAAACRWRRRSDPVDDTFYVHWHLDRGRSLEPSARYTVDGVTLPAAELLARITGRAS
jgi:hypothetical protein